MYTFFFAHLQVTHGKLCLFSLLAAQLDNIGFSIIRKGIQAVETRGKKELGATDGNKA